MRGVQESAFGDPNSKSSESGGTKSTRRDKKMIDFEEGGGFIKEGGCGERETGFGGDMDA